jgi:hypothetical protein
VTRAVGHRRGLLVEGLHAVAGEAFGGRLVGWALYGFISPWVVYWAVLLGQLEAVAGLMPLLRDMLLIGMLEGSCLRVAHCMRMGIRERDRLKVPMLTVCLLIID